MDAYVHSVELNQHILSVLKEPLNHINNSFHHLHNHYRKYEEDLRSNLQRTDRSISTISADLEVFQKDIAQFQMHLEESLLSVSSNNQMDLSHINRSVTSDLVNENLQLPRIPSSSGTFEAGPQEALLQSPTTTFTDISIRDWINQLSSFILNQQLDGYKLKLSFVSQNVERCADGYQFQIPRSLSDAIATTKERSSGELLIYAMSVVLDHLHAVSSEVDSTDSTGNIIDITVDLHSDASDHPVLTVDIKHPSDHHYRQSKDISVATEATLQMLLYRLNGSIEFIVSTDVAREVDVNTYRIVIPVVALTSTLNLKELCGSEGKKEQPLNPLTSDSLLQHNNSSSSGNTRHYVVPPMTHSFSSAFYTEQQVSATQSLKTDFGNLRSSEPFIGTLSALTMDYNNFQPLPPQHISLRATITQDIDDDGILRPHAHSSFDVTPVVGMRSRTSSNEKSPSQTPQLPTPSLYHNNGRPVGKQSQPPQQPPQYILSPRIKEEDEKEQSSSSSHSSHSNTLVVKQPKQLVPDVLQSVEVVTDDVETVAEVKKSDTSAKTTSKGKEAKQRVVSEDQKVDSKERVKPQPRQQQPSRGTSLRGRQLFAGADSWWQLLLGGSGNRSAAGSKPRANNSSVVPTAGDALASELDVDANLRPRRPSRGAGRVSLSLLMPTSPQASSRRAPQSSSSMSSPSGTMSPAGVSIRSTATRNVLGRSGSSNGSNNSNGVMMTTSGSSQEATALDGAANLPVRDKPNTTIAANVVLSAL